MDALKLIVDRYNVDLKKQSPHKLHISRFGDFVRLFRWLDYKVGVEVGVDRGRMSKAICAANPGVKLFCVDPWLQYDNYHDIEDQNQFNENEQVARERLAPFDCTIMKKTSMEAIEYFEPESLDFIWIDGNHRFEYVIEDIIYWERIIRPGGIVAGHDYIKRLDFGVIEAVDAYTKYHNIKPWFLLGKDKSPGWFWVK